LPKGDQFTIANGVVTTLFKVEHGLTQSKAFEIGETWSVAGNQVIKTEVEHGRTETSTYADLNSDGLFTKISEAFVNNQTGAWVTVADMAKQHDRDGYDNLSGSAENDDLYGGLGNDLLNGGDDLIVGGDGAGNDDDYYYYDGCNGG
jgi:Ca2+-binding RTX toxin-like protein